MLNYGDARILSFRFFLYGADRTKIITGAALHTFLLIDLILFIAGENALQGTISKTAATCNTFLIDDIHILSLLSVV